MHHSPKTLANGGEISNCSVHLSEQNKEDFTQEKALKGIQAEVLTLYLNVLILELE